MPTLAVRAVLFDLFGTVVHFAPRPPTEGSGFGAPMAWLREAAARELPGVRFEDLLPALMEVSEELVRQRPPEYLEVPSRERFRRAVERVGVDAQRAAAVAERLSLVHMAHLASTTRLPAGHSVLLQGLAARYRLGVVSNFDHGPTARHVLAMHGIEPCFEVVLISDGFGRRKPHPAIFAAALGALGVGAHEAVYVGDSVADDVIGAANAQLAMIWIKPRGEVLPADVPPPRHIIGALGELPALLTGCGSDQ